MDLKEMLRLARQREMDIQHNFIRKTEEYKLKVLENNEIRRQLEKEEKELFEKGSEWGKALEEIRVLERLIEGGGD